MTKHPAHGGLIGRGPSCTRSFRFATCLALPALFLLSGCTPPLQVTAKSRKLAVAVTLQSHFPGLGPEEEARVQAGYRDALKRRLTGVADVVSEVAWDAPDRPFLEIRVTEAKFSGYPAKGDLFKGWLRDTTFDLALAGVASQLPRTTPAPPETTQAIELSDTLVGRYVVRANHKHRLEQLGYRPFLVSGDLIFRGNGMTYRCAFEGWKLLARMHPLTKAGDQDQSAQIRREEAEALADYVLERLKAQSQWEMSPDRFQPGDSFY